MSATQSPRRSGQPRRATRTLVVGLVLALLAVLGACGNDEPLAGAPTTTTSVVPTTDPAVGSGATDDEPLDTTATTEPPPPRSFTVAATGDILLHTPVHASALGYGGGQTYDFGPMFDEVRATISGADLSICHLETPLSADSTDLAGFPLFNAPAEIAVAMADAGYDGCSTASNHSLDRGFDGVRQTLDVLDDAGLGHSGMARTAEEAAAPPIYEVVVEDDRVVQVGHLSFTYSFNGIPLPSEAPFAANLIDQDRIIDDAAALRARGAEVVLVSLQWGLEYQAQPSADQLELAEVLLDSPEVDAIIGTHVHVIQPVARIGDKVVIYGLGNFLSNQVQRQDTLDGVILELDFHEQPGGRFVAGDARWTPTRVEVGPHRIRVVSPESHPDSFERTRSALEMLGPFGGEPTTAEP